MKPIFSDFIESCRVLNGPFASQYGLTCGFFYVPFRNVVLKAMVYDGTSDGWEHVSVSLPNRTPNWVELSLIKDYFWDTNECATQFFVPKKDHINNHPYCLHLWRQQTATFELPCNVDGLVLNTEVREIKCPKVNVKAELKEYSNGWKRVQVSLKDRYPTWLELTSVKDTFWQESECAALFHLEQKTNNDFFALDIWENKNKQFELPNPITVGVKDVGVI